MVMIPNAPRMGDLPKGGEPIPEGVYYLRCDKATFKTSKKGQPMVEAQLTVFGPEEAEQYHGRKVFEIFMLAGDGAFRVRQFFEAAGENEDFQLEDTDQFLTREVAAVVGIEKERKDPDTGQEYSARNRISRYMAVEAADLAKA